MKNLMLLTTLLGFILATNYLFADKDDDERWDKVVKAVEARALSLKNKDKEKELTEKEVFDLNKDLVMAFSTFVSANYGEGVGESVGFIKRNPDRKEKMDSLPSWDLALKTLLEIGVVTRNEAGEPEAKVMTLVVPLAKKLGDTVSLLVKEYKVAKETKEAEEKGKK